MDDQELIARAKRMCLVLKGFRMSMSGVDQSIPIGVNSLGRLTSLAMLGHQVISDFMSRPEDAPYQEMLAAESVGSYFAKYIKPNYKAEKVGEST